MRFEIIFMYLFDVGRSVDVEAAGRLLSQEGGKTGLTGTDRRPDTPASLLLPTPLTAPLADLHLHSRRKDVSFGPVHFRAKIYEEGVVTIECRAEVKTKLNQLHTLRSGLLESDGGPTTLDAVATSQFKSLMDRIGEHVNQDQYLFASGNREDYFIFCLIDPVKDPQKFLSDHSDYLAPFLLGENPEVSLHASQISTTLKTPFSFTSRDAAIFDMDRAFLIAPDRDYEDLLAIIEHANYQLLELRTLDRLLDRLLDDAERDVHFRSKSSWRGKRALPRSPRKLRSLSQKLENLQPLRLDALFILENLENSSRIIGDYYLEEIYDHLCSIFNTKGWKNNVERRLEILQSIYTLTKNDRTDSTMVILELLVVVMIAVELGALIFPLIKL